METQDADRARLMAAGLNLIQQAISIYGADLRLRVSNRRFREMFDLPDHLVTPGAGFAETIRYLASRGEYGDVGDIERFVAEKVRQARAFEPHYMERERANGRTISVEGTPLPRGGWVTVYTDITETKAHEQMLRARSAQLSEQLLAHAERLAEANRMLAATNAALAETQRELTEAEARTRLATEMTPAHIAHLDLEERYTYSNKRLSNILATAPADIVGKTLAEVLGPEARARIRPHLERAWAGHPSVFEFTHEPTGRRLRVAFTPDTTGDTGPVRGVYILSMDITEETQARAALAQSRKRALAAQLTSGMAHDFANLLTIILGLQGKLARMPDLPDEAAELVRATQAAARRGGALLDRIGRISGPRELRDVPTDIARLLRELATIAGPSLPDGITLSTSIEDLDRAVLVDAGSLQDALLNLVLNARDAIAGAGAPRGVIEIAARRRGETWFEISVTDTGPGFSDEALAHALDPFFTTRRSEGSGLGLAMVYDFVKLSGGTIRLRNRASGGAQVTFRLPLRPAPDATTPRLVLLVEDTADVRASVREMLVALGHNVVEAADAHDARALAEAAAVDLVLSDITLNGSEDGLTLVRSLREVLPTADIRLMTSLPPTDAQMRRAAAEFPLIRKPFELDALARFLTSEGRA